MEYAHNNNITVHVWTVNNPSTLRDCLLLGCDWVMTDRPVEMRKLAREIYGQG